MIKKILFVLAYPFILLYLLVSLPFKIAYLVFKDRNKKSVKKNETEADNEVDFFHIGKLLFESCHKEFKEFYTLYATDRKQLIAKYSLHLPDNNSEVNSISMLQQFGDLKQKISMTDWRGEENAGEIEQFIELQIDQKIVWTNVLSCRVSTKENNQRDGKFILQLFKSIDKDLQKQHCRLLFFEMGWDAYVYMPVSIKTFAKILTCAPNEFKGAEDL